MKYLFSLFFLSLYFVSWAQPANDDCAGIIDLGTAPVCPETIFTNVNATPTDIGNDNDPGCFSTNTPENDVWFQFLTDNVIVNYEISVISTEDGGNSGIDNIQFAIYRGFCGEDNLFLNSCQIGSSGDGNVSLVLDDLTPNEIYYIRVDNYAGNSFEGDFTLCIEEKAPDSDITEGFSDDCEGILYDSGGPDGNYEDNEDYVFTICPEEFHQCVIFNLEYFNIDNSGDAITFFNGPSTGSPIISEITGSDFSDNGGGGVCYKVQADSCLTIQFISDNSINFEGFKANWNCTVETCQTDDLVEVVQNATYEEIENAISTPLAQVKVDTVICIGVNFFGDTLYGYGVFQNGINTDLGMNRGIVMSSGNVNSIGAQADNFASDFLGADGDEDLDILSELQGNFNTSNDACIVEVDVDVFSEKLEFEYIFGSEEYPEFVNTTFNDIFALFIEGPGIVGIDELDGKENMAIIPGTDTEISINSVNNLTNWEYYRNNSNSQSVTFDGLTSGFLGNKKTLTASATVQPCSTYHLKFAVADRGDSSFDSGVFISEIRSGEPKIGDFSSGLDYFIEKCLVNNSDTVSIILDEVLPDTAFFITQVEGTATAGVDYIFNLPDTLVYPPGDTILKFPIEIFDDGIEEGDETIIIKLFREVGCENKVATEIEIFIRENALVEIQLETDSLITCAYNTTNISAKGANSYTWTPFPVFDDPFIEDPIIEAGYSGWVYVEGKVLPFTDPSCTGYDSVFLNSIDPSIEILNEDTIQICQFDTITLNAFSNLDESNISWSASTNFLLDTDSASVDFVANFGFVGFNVEVIATASLAGCFAQDTIIIQIDPYTFITPAFSDTTICAGTELMLNEPGFSFNGTIFDWSPEDFLDDPEDAFTTTIPEEDITYELISTSISGFCADTFNYDITVIPNSVEILDQDEIRICKGETYNLNLAVVPSDAEVTWDPNTNITINSNNNVDISPLETVNYEVTSSNGICSSTDVIRVYVDSLPKMPITAIPVRDPYCKGEIITFISPAYQKFKFPNIEHEWMPTLGQGQDSDNTDYNYTISAQETTTYIRTTTNGACSTEDSIMINVIDPVVTISLQDTTICEGESLDLDISGNGDTDNIEWGSNSGTFTCDDCEETTLENITENTTVTVSADVEGCPADANFDVTVISYAGNITLDTMQDCNFYGDILNLTANIFPTPPEGSTIRWFGPDGNELPEFLNSINATITLPGDDGSDIEPLNYYWTVEDPKGCTGSGGIDICVDRRFDVPNAFSPNNDGTNDVFRVVDYGVGMSSIEVLDFSVFNRWGQRVFLCEDFECATDTGWNGRFNDQNQPGGTYFYHVKLRYPDGNVLEYEGDLLLLR